jgi:hypothetical protein
MRLQFLGQQHGSRLAYYLESLRAVSDVLSVTCLFLFLNNLSDSSFLFSVEILGSLFFHLVE